VAQRAITDGCAHSRVPHPPSRGESAVARQEESLTEQRTQRADGALDLGWDAGGGHAATVSRRHGP